jgi:hypothetical protein
MLFRNLASMDVGMFSIDLFVVPTVSFRLLYGFLVLRHHRRKITREPDG